MTTNQEQKAAKMKVELSVYVGIGLYNKGDIHGFSGKFSLLEEPAQVTGSNGMEVVKIGNYTLEIDGDINVEALAEKHRADFVNNEKKRLLASLAALEAESAQELEA